jgi:hypothetical protein
MTLVHGPSHPDMFRVQVGRFGDRFYVDNLPPDEICDPDTSQPMPSVSVIKGAFPKFLNNWVAGVTAGWAFDNQKAWSQLDRESAVEVISKASNRIKNEAADRGSTIHGIVEDLCFGRHVNELLIPDKVRPFMHSVKRMVAEMQLEPMFMECVVFNHEIEYGGTFDYIGSVGTGNRKRVGLLDFKTREKYNVYEDEAAQLAAYAGAEYIIGEVAGEAKRIKMPKIDFAAIVTITPHGYQIHEVDLDNAWVLWVSLADFWRAKRLKMYKGIVPASGIAQPEQLKEQLKERIGLMSAEARKRLAASWPAGLPTLKQDPEPYQLLEIERLIARHTDYEGFEGFGSDVDEGGECDPTASSLLRSLLEASDDHIKDAVEFFYARCQPPVRLSASIPRNTVRRFEILRALLALAEKTNGNTALMSKIVDMENLGTWTKEHAAEIADTQMWGDVDALEAASAAGDPPRDDADAV